MVAAWVAITDCITSLPSALSTATEMVLWWTSRPIYLMLSIGCSFRRVWFTASHSNQILLRKGRPFIMRGPGLAVFETWVQSLCTIPRLGNRARRARRGHLQFDRLGETQRT